MNPYLSIPEVNSVTSYVICKVDKEGSGVTNTPVCSSVAGIICGLWFGGMCVLLK